MARVVIIIPTYNESVSTALMIEALAKIIPSVDDHEILVLYIDGKSPDGTADVIREKQKVHPWLRLIVEEKKNGLGMAYAKGMRHAMDELSADYLMEFDGDFQHRPGDIPRLLNEIRGGYDYIIGSRYIPGGSIPKNWGLKRKFLSLAGNYVARFLLILPQIHDVTGGFKLARVHGFMDKFDFGKLYSRSFAYKIHLLYFMVRSGAAVREVPISFEPRTEGESKLIKNEVSETFKVIFKLLHERFFS